MKRRHNDNFVEWCPTAFKIGICNQPEMAIARDGDSSWSYTRSATGLINTTAIVDPLKVMINKFNKLFRKRSFVHWYMSEGMEEAEFTESKDTTHNIVARYEEMAAKSEIETDYHSGA